LSVQIKNLSLGGACVFSQHSFSSATDVTIALEMSSRKLTLPGRTVYSFQCEPGIFRTGIRFQQLSDESRAVITAMTEQAK
jgi:hypothetical protein